MGAKRIFIAIDISDAVRQAIGTYVAEFRRTKCDGVRWERLEKIHLTLKFLGDTEDHVIGRLNDELSNIASNHSPIMLTANATGTFPSEAKARILWLGINEHPELTRIHYEIDAACQKLGFVREKRRFHPHLTIARIKLPINFTRQLAEIHTASRLGPIVFPVREIKVYESKLLPSGSVYQPVSKHELR